MLKEEILGKIKQIYVHNSTFILAKIVDADSAKGSQFWFKGFCGLSFKPKANMFVTLIGIFDKHQKYGLILHGEMKNKLIDTTRPPLSYGKDLISITTAMQNSFTINSSTALKSKTTDKIAIQHKFLQSKPYTSSRVKALRNKANIAASASNKIDVSFKLTEEQQKIITLAKTGKNLKIKAFAGTGKTSTLVEIAKNISGSGLYIAYNKAIQIDASSKFPRNVLCKTAHSLAYAANYSKIHGRLTQLTPLIFMHFVQVSNFGKYKPIEIAFIAIKVIRLFCNSEHAEIGKNFIENENFAMFDNLAEDKTSLLNYVSKLASEYWDFATATNSKVPIEHDFYLKMYQLSHPNLSQRFKFILFDESQDANPVLIKLISKQLCQIIYVGDEHQQIYGWRGAVNAMEQLDGEHAYLSQSFRFGNCYAELANIILELKGEKCKLRGNEKINSIIVSEKPPSYTLLARTNAGLIEKLIEKIKEPVCVVGDIKEIILLAKSGYALYLNDKAHIFHHKLKNFDSWDSLKNFNENFSDPDLGFLVRMVERYKDNFVAVIDAIENANYVSEINAKYIFSTIHKAKGREWPCVVINDDFQIFTAEGGVSMLLQENKEEFNLIYVAMTRAQNKLYLEKGLKQFLKKFK